MKYNQQNQSRKGRGKSKSFGDQNSAPESSAQQQEAEASNETEPWKQKLQTINLEDDQQSGGGAQQDKNEKKRKGEQSKTSDESYSEKSRGEEGADEELENEESGRKGKTSQRLGKRVKNAVDYLKERSENMDTNKLTKYATIGVLLFVGMRKAGFLGGLVVSLAAALLTKSVVQGESDMPQEEEEEGEETETATS